jgi:hypothetical protein
VWGDVGVCPCSAKGRAGVGLGGPVCGGRCVCVWWFVTAVTWSRCGLWLEPKMCSYYCHRRAAGLRWELGAGRSGSAELWNTARAKLHS